jgi:extradiol dioxygenase
MGMAVKNLACVGFTSPAADEWRDFGPSVLGMALADDGPGGAVRLRVDDAAWRIEIAPGPSNELVSLGWQVDGPDVPDPITDPFGFRHEFTAGLPQGPSFDSAFVTGEQGVGHMVLLVPDLAEAEAFYTGVLGLRLTDTITAGGVIRFFHCQGRAARHHTVALAEVPGLVGMHHLMVEVRSLDDVGLALDRVNARGLQLAMGLGRHPNDLMTSFYVRTPSGFEIEYGWGGVVVDDESGVEAEYGATSLWGHKPPAGGMLPAGAIKPFQPEGAPA